MAESNVKSQSALLPIDWYWQGTATTYDVILNSAKLASAESPAIVGALGVGSNILGGTFIAGSIIIGAATEGANGAVKGAVTGVSAFYGAEAGFEVGFALGGVPGAIAGTIVIGVGSNYLAANLYDKAITPAGGPGDEVPPGYNYTTGTLTIGAPVGEALPFLQEYQQLFGPTGLGGNTTVPGTSLLETSPAQTNSPVEAVAPGRTPVESLGPPSGSESFNGVSATFSGALTYIGNALSYVGNSIVTPAEGATLVETDELSGSLSPSDIVASDFAALESNINSNNVVGSDFSALESVGIGTSLPAEAMPSAPWLSSVSADESTGYISTVSLQTAIDPSILVAASSTPSANLSAYNPEDFSAQVAANTAAQLFNPGAPAVAPGYTVPVIGPTGDLSTDVGGLGSYYGPIVLDVAGLLGQPDGGIEITQLSSSDTFFDMSGNGQLNETAWPGAGNGVLFFDPTGTGQLTQANQIIFTDWDPSANSDMQALQDVFDTNHDGQLDSGDTSFSDFYVMVTNADGTKTAYSLAALGITSISLTANTTNLGLPDGSAITGEATYTTSGGTGIAATVNFTTDPIGYAVSASSATNGDGSITLKNIARNPDGSVAFTQILNTLITSSTSGGTTSVATDKTLSELNAGGVVTSLQTDDTTAVGSNFTTETVTNYRGGAVTSTGELTSAGTSGALELNATTTITSVGSGGTVVTIDRDQLGGGWTSEQEIDTYNSDGSLLSRSTARLSP